MNFDITFHTLSAATLGSSEDARLICANALLVGLLLPAEKGWFLQMGLGPCEAEGIVFAGLDDAEAWVKSRMLLAPFSKS